MRPIPSDPYALKERVFEALVLDIQGFNWGRVDAIRAIASHRSGLLRTEPLSVSALPEPAAIACSECAKPFSAARIEHHLWSAHSIRTPL